MMRILGNILWLVLGGLETAIGYLVGSFFLAITIIGLPLAWQTLKLGFLCLWPFGARVRNTSSSLSGCLYLILNIIWLITGGIWIALTHLFFGILLCITIIGIPWGRQHFKMADFALTPFGRDIEW